MQVSNRGGGAGLREFEPVIGLEVHAQLRTATKIFCSCAVRFGEPPNSLTCPVCLGMPGVLPVLNRQAVALAMRLALAVGCEVRRRSIFARKNYFYPDLPKGYQISQFDQPLAEHGRLEIEVGGATRAIGITRVHMEEDAGKLIHEGPLAVPDATLADYNRAGTPLIEIVGEPDLRSPEEAYAYLTALKSVLTYTGVCDGNMEEGSLRCDANVSIREKGSAPFGTRVELKNLNSFRNVERALRFEIARQEEVVRSGGSIPQETLLWDADAGVTRSMRSKEEAHDYRYFPDPDLLPLVVSEEWVEEVRRTIPELPAARRARFVAELGLAEADAHLLTLEKPLADWFEAVVQGGGPGPEQDRREGPAPQPGDPAGSKPAKTGPRVEAAGAPAFAIPPREAAKRVLREIMSKLKEEGLSPAALADRYPARYLAALIGMQLDGTISGTSAVEVFERSWRMAGEPGGKGADPEAIVAELGLGQISDEGPLVAAVEAVIAASPKQVGQFRAGKESVFGYFVGQVMKATGGRANAATVNRLLRERLAKPE